MSTTRLKDGEIGAGLMSADAIASAVMEECGERDINLKGYFIRRAYDALIHIGGGVEFEEAYEIKTIQNKCVEKPKCLARLSDIRVDNECNPPLFTPRKKFTCLDTCRNIEAVLNEYPDITKISESDGHYHFSSNVADGTKVFISYLKYMFDDNNLPMFDSKYRLAIVEYCMWRQMKRDRQRFGRKSKYTLSDIKMTLDTYLGYARRAKASDVRLVPEEIDQIMADWHNFYYIPKNPYRKVNQASNMANNESISTEYGYRSFGYYNYYRYY